MPRGSKPTVAFVSALLTRLAPANADAFDWRNILPLQQEIIQADRRGDFKSAAHAAEQCVTASSAELGDVPEYCAYYLSSALKLGKGLPRDQDRAFSLLKSVTTKDMDDEAALALVESYLDGSGTPRDAIEAGIVFWRVEHGAWSIYSPYWGMCDECAEFHRYEQLVAYRISRELTAEEKQTAESLAVERFPAIAERVKRRDAQIEWIEILIATLIAAFGCLIWWWPRSLKLSN
ncbi:hypothetical protein FJ987_13860 [Mesorhizobium sp. CU2]|uniref:hypothetical protein n=1 Tax=unclassified Mesorhizobium TaxID=325217 RepID=UPI00112E235E|nr:MULTISPECIES: hypothetical protein [unclassified Mesorhizobium]TPN74539.1 hypothetical protein FJ988_30410 [Mesorhizobium sp. CU3]TPO14617.1 hypothetical protein FJ987_13860 [Mesorhizobium sp. CU2]